MRIGLEHIDPVIAAAMRERLCANGAQFLKDHIRWADAPETSLLRLFFNKALRRPEQREPEEFERFAQMIHRQREKMTQQRAGIALGSALVGGPLIGMLFYTLLGTLWIGVAIGLAIGITALAVGGYWAWQATSAHELFYEVSYNEFLAVVPLLPLTDLEAAYCDLLTQVCDHDPNQEARRAVRRHIVTLKEVPVLGRQLDLLADAAEQNDLATLHTRIEEVSEEMIEAIHAITVALCTILVVPSPAGDRAAELIDKTLRTYRQAIETMAPEASAVQPTRRKPRREKVS